ncbi:tripartite tricarboxylate transporter substrate-binding protein [Bosea sp. LjRoot90]|uniref:tripartite tricarboxylate transporter substrate-binding protein n=1 Tax=Bosea sp. LjRoot90 TaxID=3342342 RepID=UPI003ED033D2
MNRRLFLTGVATMAAGQSFAQQNAAPWPARPIRFIVPYAAGGPTDVAARILAETLSQRLPQHVVVENVTGAGTVVGTARAAAMKDGHTFLIATVAHAVNTVLYANLTFDPVRDFRGVALMGTVPQIVLVRNSFAGNSLADLLAAARAKSGGLTYGSAGIGSAQHLAAELLAKLAKINLVHVPYRGSGPAVTDLIGGQLDLVIDSAATALTQVKGGALRALAVTTKERLPALPELPTVAETLPGYEAYTWNAVLAPAGTAPEIIAAMNRITNAALADPALTRRFEELGIAVAKNSTPEATDTFVASEMAKWQPILRSAGIAPN